MGSADQMLNLLKRITEEMANERQETQQHRDEMRQDIAGIKTQLHIIQQRISMNGKPTQDMTAYMPLPKGNRVRFEDDVSENGSIHKECIQDNLELLVKDINLEESLLIDQLVEDSCLSADEASSICNYGKKKDKVRKLALLLSHRDKKKFDQFIKILKCDYQHISEKLTESYESKVRAGKTPSKCLICSIKKYVCISDVVDKLVSSSIVTIEFYDVFCSNSGVVNDQSNLWEIVFASIDQSRDRREKLKLLQEALSDKYENLSAKFNIWERPRLKCQCYSKTVGFVHTSTQSPYSVDSSVELSTTSETNTRITKSTSISSVESLVDYSNIPATVQWLQNVDETFSITSASSDQDYSHLGNPQPSSHIPVSAVNDTTSISKVEKHTGTWEVFNKNEETVYNRQASQHSLHSIGESLRNTTKAQSEANPIPVTQTSCMPPISPSLHDEGKNRKKKKKKRKKQKQNSSVNSDWKDTENNAKQEDKKDLVNSNIPVVTKQVSISRASDVILTEMKNIETVESTTVSNTRPASPSQVVLSLNSFDVTNSNNGTTVLIESAPSGPSDRNNNPTFVTEQQIITPSKSVISHSEESNNSATRRNKRSRKKKYK